MIKLYKIDSPDNKPELVIEGHSDAVYSVCLAKDSKIISGSLDKSVRVWQFDMHAKTYTLQSTLKDHKDFCLAVSLTRDERWLATCSKDRSVCLYKFNQGNPVLECTLQGHRNSVISCAFSSKFNGDDQSFLLGTAGGDNRARIWKLQETHSQ